MSKVLTGITIGLAAAAFAAPLAQADVSRPNPWKIGARPHPWKVGDVSRPNPWRSLGIQRVHRMNPMKSSRIGY